MSNLDEIFTHKRTEIAGQKAALPLAEMTAQAAAAPPPRDFVAALRQARARPALIAEIKRGSPSRGLLVADFDPLRLAAIYADNGATAISVLTDERFFGGSLDHLRAVARARKAGRAQGLPLLRKDFICDPYQVYQARAAGADAILLIVASLAPALLAELLTLAQDLGMAALVEVHDEAELEIALASHARLVGINNRNLHDFSVSLETTLRLGRRVPPRSAWSRRAASSRPRTWRGWRSLNVRAAAAASTRSWWARRWSPRRTWPRKVRALSGTQSRMNQARPPLKRRAEQV